MTWLEFGRTICHVAPAELWGCKGGVSEYSGRSNGHWPQSIKGQLQLLTSRRNWRRWFTWQKPFIQGPWACSAMGYKDSFRSLLSGPSFGQHGRNIMWPSHLRNLTLAPRYRRRNYGHHAVPGRFGKAARWAAMWRNTGRSQGDSNWKIRMKISGWLKNMSGGPLWSSHAWCGSLKPEGNVRKAGNLEAEKTLGQTHEGSKKVIDTVWIKGIVVLMGLELLSYY